MYEEKRQAEYCDIASLNQSCSRLNELSTSNPIFICVISYTATSEIPGITMAGANGDLLKFTSAADSEFLYYGYCKCINGVPVTPDGKPTPAIVTRSALLLTGIPFLIVDAGSKIKPYIPYISFNVGSGNNIKIHDAIDIGDVKKAYDYGIVLGKQLSKSNDLVVVGESIPGGTTTALGVLIALGIDAKFKMSSSMPENPHDLKNDIVDECMKRVGIGYGGLKDDPFKAISLFGDPMIPSVAGIAAGVMISGGRVMLAGGTQMSAVVAILNSLRIPTDNLCIGTTSYVARDRSSNLVDLMNLICADIPIYSSNLHMIESSKPGLRAFAKGYVKEGVGSGGVSITSMLRSKGSIDGSILLKAIEHEYDSALDKALIEP
ncbi:MAG TPA: TIGR00303 family protein [Nitrososphaeraceae archaeon]|nr:TIGR00303 family protein [Nitrososphaeraceae archaeon]